MTQITPWPDTALHARRLLRLLDRNDGVCLKWELDNVGRSLEPWPELSTFEAERWELLECGGFAASLTDRDSPGVRALARAMESVWRTKPLFYRSGGSIGAGGQMQKILGADSVLTGFSLPDDNIHGPNEKLHLPTWERGIDALIYFFHYLAERPRS